MQQIAAILLAAGRSERMGAFKPLLPFGRKSVAQSCIDYLREANIENIVVVLGHNADELQPELAASGVDFTWNPDLKAEMDSSIACGVRALPFGSLATIIALVDHPAISPDVVKTLVASWKNGAQIVKPTWHERGGHPVLIDLQFREQLLQLDPERGLKSLFEAQWDKVTRVAVDCPYVARDMDTWDDYDALHRDVFGYEPPANA